MKQILILSLCVVFFSNCGKDSTNNITVPAKVQWDGCNITSNMEKYVVIDNTGGSIQLQDEPSFIPIAIQKYDDYFNMIKPEYWNFSDSDKVAYTELYSGGNWAGLQSFTYKVNGNKITVTSSVSGVSYQLILDSPDQISSPSYMIIDQPQGTAKEDTELSAGFYEVGSPANEKANYLRADILGNGLNIHDTVYVAKISVKYKAI